MTDDTTPTKAIPIPGLPEEMTLQALVRRELECEDALAIIDADLVEDERTGLRGEGWAFRARDKARHVRRELKAVRAEIDMRHRIAERLSPAISKGAGA